MKKSRFLIMGMFALLSACSTIKSTTYIEPKQSFVLGENNHLSYSASVKNIGADKVEVLLFDKKGNETNLGTLAVGQSEKYRVPANHTVKFKNLSTNEDAKIKIRVVGDTGLSMGYK